MKYPKEWPGFEYRNRSYREVLTGTLTPAMWLGRLMTFPNELVCFDHGLLGGDGGSVAPCFIPFEKLRPLTPTACEMLRIAKGL